ncbi:glycerol kinase [Auraticoccus sp. F435]|uniref:ATP:glycerol 3-phosphotransferase n=1 Tax=Auraticoccus cholistanensis TaxID=2656650 RepID=A0A6A9UPN8_9ACTN|nr:FGGY family carbohydrate kinase [Auraticoccus cholistanensis]MVA74683.1 glycerol kinase [Auraticoccus cholistanensis]
MTTILSIDQGTTNTKAVLVDDAGRVLSRSSAPVRLSVPRPGWAEQDAEEIWASCTVAVAGCLEGRRPPDAVAVSNQRESVVAWDARSGTPRGPLIGWQDARTADWCARPEVAAAEPLVRARTGLPLDPMFSAPKIRWLLQQHGAAGTRVGTVDSWLLHRLTGGAVHRCEAGNAGRTLLYDVERLGWSAELCEVFGVPASCLPEVLPSDAEFGRTRGVPGVRDGTPVVAVLADSHAALYAHGCRLPGTGKATYGTGSSVMTPTGTLQGGSALSSTLAWLTSAPCYAREGNVVTSGAALVWLAGLLQLPDVAALLRLAAGVPDPGDVVLVPALAGLGAPHWDRAATGTVLGMTGSTTAAHLARAAVEAVAHQVCDIVEVVDAETVPLQALRADGGATASALLMQAQADLLGRPVEVAEVAELSALGAAHLGLAATGPQPPAAGTTRRYEPDLDEAERVRRRERWRAAVAVARDPRTRPGGGPGTTLGTG